MLPFESWEQVEAVVAELDPRYAAIPIVAVGTGLRPEEWIGLHRADLDREVGLLNVRRRFTQGVLKDGGKTEGSVRSVPLRRRVLEALDAMPARIDTKVLLPAPRGGYVDIERFRHRHWKPALRAAGLEHRRIYDCRHTFATWAIEGGMSLILLARAWARACASSRTPTSVGSNGRTSRCGQSSTTTMRPRLGTDWALERRETAMRMRGLEPPRPYGHTDLNRARLPIPPHPRGRPILASGRLSPR